MTLFKVVAKNPDGKKVTRTERGHKKSIVETLIAQGYELVKVRKIEERRFA